MKCSVCGGEKVKLELNGVKRCVCPVCDYEKLTPEEQFCVRFVAFGESRADTVDHPAHYASGGVECIDAMTKCFGTKATQDFCLLNAFKYLWRCKSKHKTPEEDIKKAKWYLDKWISLQENSKEKLNTE